MLLDITSHDQQTVTNLIKAFLPGTTIWAFGSRVKFTSKPESDLDLVAFIEAQQESDLADLKEAFAESDLPFKVDLLQWNTAPENFKANIAKDYVIFNLINSKNNGIPKGWKSYKLKELAELRKEGYLPNNEHLSYIGLEHIEQQTLRLNSIGSSLNVTSNKFKFHAGDTLYGKLRPYFRKVYRPLFDGVCSTDIYVIKNKKPILQDYLYYLVASEEFTNIAVSGSGGTKMPRADWKHLENASWNVPESLSEQRYISLILSSLDSRIELNQQMNKTLEEIAQSIFKEWFVKFNFPGFDGELVDSLPKGWSYENVGKIISIQNGFAFSGESFIEKGEEGVIKIKNISNNVVDINNLQFIEPSVATKMDLRFKVDSQDLLIAMTGAEVGKIGIVPDTTKKLWLNQRVGLFKEKVKFSKWFCYLILSTAEYQKRLLNSATGSAQPNISSSQIESTLILLPELSLIQKFGYFVDPIFRSITQNYNYNKTLIELRESLLPKLMTGKIQVSA